MRTMLLVLAGTLGLGSGVVAQVDVAGRESTLFTIEDVDELDRAAGLSDEQRRTVRDLMLGAMTELRAARAAARAREELRRAEAEARLGEDVEAVEATLARPDPKAVNVPNAAALEAKTYAALQALLSDQQVGRGWETFMRHRRGMALGAVAIGADGGPGTLTLVRLETLVAEAGLGPEDRKLVGPIIAGVRERMDVSLRGLIDAARRAGAPGEKMAEVERAVERRRELEDALRLEHLRACGAVQAAVSAEGRAKVLRRRVEREGLAFEVQRTGFGLRVEKIGEIRERADVGNEVKAALGELRERGRAEILDALTPELERRDREVLAGRAWMLERGTRRTLVERIVAIDRRVWEEAMGIVGPDVARAYDPGAMTTGQLEDLFYGTGRRGRR